MLSLRLFDSITWEFLSVSICTQKRIRHHSESNSSDQKVFEKRKRYSPFPASQNNKDTENKTQGDQGCLHHTQSWKGRPATRSSKDP